jgi:hypothetical protein
VKTEARRLGGGRPQAGQRRAPGPGCNTGLGLGIIRVRVFSVRVRLPLEVSSRLVLMIRVSQAPGETKQLVAALRVAGIQVGS